MKRVKPSSLRPGGERRPLQRSPHLDVQSINRIASLTPGAPTNSSWADALNVVDSGNAATLSDRARSMLKLYYDLRSRMRNISLTFQIYAAAEVWHKEKDKSESLDEIIKRADNSLDFQNTILGYFSGKSSKIKAHYITWAFAQLKKKNATGFRDFATALTTFLFKAARQTPTVKQEMRSYDKNIDDQLLGFIHIVDGFEDSADLRLWNVFHKS